MNLFDELSQLSTLALLSLVGLWGVVAMNPTRPLTIFACVITVAVVARYNLRG